MTVAHRVVNSMSRSSSRSSVAAIEDGKGHFSGDGSKRMAAFDVLEESLHWHARADEHESAAEDVWVGVDD
jgi:hypothetical protein